MAEHNLPDKDDAPWLDCMDGFKDEYKTLSKLSPQAQAVLDAYRSSHLSINNLAAALRAGVACTQQYKGKDCFSNEVWECDADELLAIAEELETNV